MHSENSRYGQYKCGVRHLLGFVVVVAVVLVVVLVVVVAVVVVVVVVAVAVIVVVVIVVVVVVIVVVVVLDFIVTNECKVGLCNIKGATHCTRNTDKHDSIHKANAFQLKNCYLSWWS